MALEMLSETLVALTEISLMLDAEDLVRDKLVECMEVAPCICFIAEVATAKYVYVNQKMCEVMGMKASEIIGKTNKQILSAESATRADLSNQRVVECREPVVVINKYSDVWFLITKFFIPNGTNCIGAFGLELPPALKLEEYMKEALNVARK